MCKLLYHQRIALILQKLNAVIPEAHPPDRRARWRSMRSSLELACSRRAISLSSCYGFAGLRLHPLLALDLANLVLDDGMPVESRKPTAPTR